MRILLGVMVGAAFAASYGMRRALTLVLLLSAFASPAVAGAKGRSWTRAEAQKATTAGPQHSLVSYLKEHAVLGVRIRVVKVDDPRGMPVRTSLVRIADGAELTTVGHRLLHGYGNTMLSAIRSLSDRASNSLLNVPHEIPERSRIKLPKLKAIGRYTELDREVVEMDPSATR